jgi:hypothetical protein
MIANAITINDNPNTALNMNCPRCVSPLPSLFQHGACDRIVFVEGECYPVWKLQRGWQFQLVDALIYLRVRGFAAASNIARNVVALVLIAGMPSAVGQMISGGVVARLEGQIHRFNTITLALLEEARTLLIHQQQELYSGIWLLVAIR